ncbi:MAG TPA: hypothetical protein VE546_24365 [Streptomyces sp.]|uniref:hypothetical protein n=1 Tax=Streptomyces sp. TaxID=1931 RepID=UPI002D5B7807|nr:hypothetical protein [Streptomyces sp.]HZG06661.1 hypothetical protein [Streptomyces sp.]
MKFRKTLSMAVAAVALVASQLLAGSAAAAPSPDSTTTQNGTKLTATQAAQLQERVENYLDKHSEARRISADKLSIPGGTVTLAAPGTNVGTTAISCSSGWLCIQDGYGDRYDYYYCGYYDFWGLGDGVFNNNQSSGTVARFYNNNGTLRWTNTAKDTGTASWTPVYHIRPC